MKQVNLQDAIAEAVKAALAGQGAGAATVTPAPAKAPAVDKVAKEAAKLAAAKALPATIDVGGTAVKLEPTNSGKGRQFGPFHATIGGVKVRINGYVMPE